MTIRAGGRGERRHVTLLPWDTEFFGAKIARARVRVLTPGNARSLLRECRDEGVQCVYFETPAAKSASIALAEANGFLLVDVRVLLARGLDGSIPSVDAGVAIDGAGPADVAPLRAMARAASRVSRYHHDPRFRRHAARLYDVWVTKACRGAPDSVLVARQGRQAIGFLTTRISGIDGKIDLVAVSPRARGRDVGAALVVAALERLKRAGMKRVEVLTQGRNVTALRLYEKAGFRVAEVSLFYHRWFR